MRPLLLICTLVFAAVLPAQDPRFNDFLAKFNKAVDYDDETGLDRAIKGDPEMALRHFNSMAWQYRNKQDPDSQKILETMKASWERAYGTLTLEKYERFIVSRTESDRKVLFDTEALEREVWALYGEAQKTKERETFIAARDGAKGVARKYEELGHALSAATMWSLAAQIGNSIPQRTLEERRDAVESIQSFVRQRDLWDWNKGGDYSRNKVWAKSELDKLNELSGVASAAAGGAAKEGVATVADADALVMPDAEEELAALEFKVVKKPHMDLFVLGGPIPPLWMSASVKNTGPTTKFPVLTPELYLVRPSANKFGVTIDGNQADMKKNKWQAVAPSAKFKPTVFYLGPNKTEPYAMWFYMCGEAEPLFGISHNLKPQDDAATIYYKSAASWESTIAGEKITLYDDNANRQLFEEDPIKFGLTDRSRGDPGRGVPVPAYDSMQIGKGPVQPISSYAKIGDQWYHLRLHQDEGEQLGARPLNPEVFKVGSVELKWQGPRAVKPKLLVLQGVGALSQARYNIAGKGAQEVPAGLYEVGFGRIVTGKGARAQQAHIFKGTSEMIAVKAGETTVVTLGAPFKLDFDRKGTGDRVDVDSSTIRVLGASGELYGRITLAPTPEVLVAKSEDGKGAKPVGEFVAMDLDNLNRAASSFGIGIEAGFYSVPKGERKGKTVLQLRLPSEDSVIGLRQKKHKMFGKLEPIYK